MQFFAIFSLGLANVALQVVDACSIDDDLAQQFDLVLLVDVFHDVAYPEKLIQGVLKLLKPGGKFIMIDIDMLGSLKENMERST